LIWIPPTAESRTEDANHPDVVWIVRKSSLATWLIVRNFCILDTLCEGAKTVSQIAGATGLSQFDVSNHLEPLLDCGCVTQRNADHSVLYGLSVPRLLQLEGIVDEMLIAALKGHRAYD
jgi:DNA-binding transcriptional ArsR family regulator